MTAVLTRSILDDGNGSARSVVFRHQHEKDTGRSSAVATEILGFAGDRALPVDIKSQRRAQWQAVHEKSDRVVTFVDLCGHEKYLKTTISGLSAMLPDYGQVVVGANMGVSKMTREHIGIAVALGLPLWVVVTKIDLAPPDVKAHTLETIAKVLKQARKMPFLIKSAENVTTAAKAILTERITPVFQVSNVTGEGLDLLRQLLREIPPRIAPLAVKGQAAKLQGEVGAGIMGTTVPAPSAPAATPTTATPPRKGGAEGGDSEPAVATTPPSSGGAGTSATATAGAGAGADASVLAELDKPGEAVIDSVFTNVPGESGGAGCNGVCTGPIGPSVLITRSRQMAFALLYIPVSRRRGHRRGWDGAEGKHPLRLHYAAGPGQVGDVHRGNPAVHPRDVHPCRGGLCRRIRGLRDPAKAQEGYDGRRLQDALGAQRHGAHRPRAGAIELLGIHCGGPAAASPDDDVRGLCAGDAHVSCDTGCARDFDYGHGWETAHGYQDWRQGAYKCPLVLPERVHPSRGPATVQGRTRQGRGPHPQRKLRHQPRGGALRKKCRIMTVTDQGILKFRVRRQNRVQC